MADAPPIRLYNTLTREKQAFKPIDDKNVRMYVCGPTVYDFAHIGNARPAIVFDVLYRLLRHRYGARHVTYVRNITDVDDKINARALRDFGGEIAAGRMSLNDAIRQVTEKTTAQYHADVAALGCLPPDVEPRATGHIAGMVAMINTLIAGGHAYVATGGEGREVLFDIAAMKGGEGTPAYGMLSRRNLDEQQAGARIEVKDHKRNPGDFVLWKESSADEPGWEGAFDWQGEAVRIHGRPGWHIECSVMAEAHLGQVFDIHGGGLDLIFPHHENEIAQSCCAHGTDRMANIWMHNGFVQVEGRKMSKSEGNLVTIHDLLHTEKFGGRKWPGEVLRLAMLMTHYREPIDFSVRRLEEAEVTMTKFRTILADHDETLRRLRREYDIEEWPVHELYGLDDDLNVNRFIAEMHAASKAATRGDEGSLVHLYCSLRLLGFEGPFRKGFQKVMPVHKNWLTEELTDLVERRLALIAEKNWAEADRIRDELLSQGIQLKDSKDSETGERITTWEVRR